ncbi:uncharacterized protein LTHEOB_5337 [Lasiodiplodia theobromae]|uniref:uncharacterized protein n=1 Tax=Lasiodiplodia theobromae TaxID=45133 RepID=UPI0015C2E5F2|nr:uncharacterized protein LTHEOB_5337 [Lasiodiplodia theobromae]KAF4545504.1 hypothetical protein LTHEOB_5337 [Lasiodiplodia theobromae]
MNIGTPSSLNYYGNKPQHRHDAEVFIPGRRLLNAVLRAADNMVAPQKNERPKIEFSEFWLSVVRQYTELNLTFSKDRLIAISAIAQRVKDHSRFTYLAGLWEETIALDLLWSTKHPESALRQETYQAPSWSWGCLNAVISNDRWGNGDYKGSSPKTWISNVQAHVNSHVEDISATGQVFEGSRLCLDGYLYPCSHMDNRQRTLFGGIGWVLHATNGADDDGFSALFLPDVESEVRALDCGLVRLLPVLSSDMMAFQGGINFWGLVLSLSGASFTRIGVWSTRTRPDRFPPLKSSIMLI